jgi:hypothetical protein
MKTFGATNCAFESVVVATVKARKHLKIARVELVHIEWRLEQESWAKGTIRA